jgi:hypothetical protein
MSDAATQMPSAEFVFGHYRNLIFISQQGLTVDFHFREDQLHLAFGVEFGQIHRKAAAKVSRLIPRHLR